MDSEIKHKNLKQMADYQKSLYLNPKLKFLFFELTDQCNLNCVHCGSRCTGKNQAYLAEYAVEKVLLSVAQAFDTSEIMICITGGEPLLHPELVRIIRMCHSLGFTVGITSNGTLINQKKAYLLAEAGLDTISISIDGIGTIHDSFRGVQGSFERALDGCRALKSVGIEPQAMTVVHKSNIFELKTMYEFFRSEDFYSWRLTNVDPIGRASQSEGLLLNGDELKYLFDFIREKRFNSKNTMDVTYGCSHFLTYDYENEVRDYYFACIAGLQVASIAANGNILACLDIERRGDLVQGNVYQDDFVDIWESRFEVFRQNRAEKSPVCKECDYQSVCMGDSAHTWDFDNQSPRYCVAKMLEGVNTNGSKQI